MNTIQTTGLILAAGAGLVATSTLAPGGETPSHRDQQLVLVPLDNDARRDIDLTSFGIAELTPDHGAPISTLHIRAVITNTAGDWVRSFDASKARVALGAGAPIGPLFVNADLVTLPLAILGRGERAMVDFYFPLAAEQAGGPATFGFTWPLHAPARGEGFARFDRAAATMRWMDRVVSAGWGASWWFDPTYAWPTYYHRPGPVMARPPKHVTVTRMPSWEQITPPVAVDEPRLDECNEW